MNDVLHLPVAEQYPSRTATVSGFASKRISGMSGCLGFWRRRLLEGNENLRPGKLQEHQAGGRDA